MIKYKNRKTLDRFPLPFSQFGLRRLNSAYSGAAVNVRRSSDNATRDIGFYGDLLDIVALLNFCGAGNGFVVTWYDQSGYGRHYTQATTGAQPTIVSSGALVTMNNQAAMSFNGTTQFLGGNTAALSFMNNAPGQTVIIAIKMLANVTTNLCMFCTSANAAASTPRTYFGLQTTNRYRCVTRSTDGGSALTSASAADNVYTNGTTFIASQIINYPTQTVTTYKNGTQDYTASGTMAVANTTDSTNSAATAIGCFTNGSSFINAAIGEVVLINKYPDIITRQSIENGMRLFYGTA